MGNPIPASVLEPPDIREGLDVYYDIYCKLSTCRNYHGRIPWTAIDQYASRYGIEDFETLEYMILGLERYYHECIAKSE